MNEALLVLNACVLGVFAGSLLTEALLLVPFFRSLAFEEFNRLHHQFGPRLYRYYAPLTISATVLPLVTAASAIITDQNDAVAPCIAAAVALMILATYFLYFRGANLAFAEQRLDATALQKELTRWAGVHNFRTALAIGGFVASVLAV